MTTDYIQITVEYILSGLNQQKEKPILILLRYGYKPEVIHLKGIQSALYLAKLNLRRTSINESCLLYSLKAAAS